jgi:hypothetical protein
MLVNGAAAPASTLALVQGGLKLMAWAKMKLAMAVAASALLAGGTAALVLANKAWADDTTETGEIKLELKSSGIGQVMRQFSALILDVDSEKPSGIKKLPSDLVAPRFGKLKLGPKESAKRFYIVWDAPPGKPNRLLIDTNGNGDLTDDEEVKWQLRPNPRVESYAGQAAFNVAYGEESAPLTVKFYSMEGKLFYYRDYGRVGQVTLGGKAYQALLDDNMTTGDFRTGPTSSHRGTMLLLDQAGRFDVTRPAFDVERPIKVDGVSYEVTGMTASGDSFRIVKSKQDGDNKAQK